MAARESEVHEIYRAEYARLAGWAAKLTGDRDLGHDVATESFVRLLAKWTRVQEPRPWLYRTATNLVHDHWRRQERERRALVRLAAPPPAEESLPDVTVRTLVGRLPIRMRTAVLLHYYADLPVHEVAAAMGTAEGTVKRTLFDARKRLGGELEGVR